MSTLDKATPEDVRYCYRLLLGREPDPEGLHGFIALVESRNVPVTELTASFMNLAEFRDRLQHTFEWNEGAPARAEIYGLPFFVDSGDPGLSSALKTNTIYEPHVWSTIERVLRPGSAFVDVGASIGLFSVLASRCVGESGRVFAFEPGPQNRSLLLLNLSTNGASNVAVDTRALGDRHGVLVYSPSGANGAVAPFDGNPSSLVSHELVTVVPLDDVIDEDVQIDLIKIDVEGAEGAVLRGAGRILRRWKPSLIFEFCPHALRVLSGVTGQRLLEELSEHGYALTVLRDSDDVLTPMSPTEICQSYEAQECDHIDLFAWT
jgi:FkbM family methyltransferase